jgi:hypothetical protein
METAEHREPYESRGSRTDLGAPGGESPPGDSTWAAVRQLAHLLQHCLSKQTLYRPYWWGSLVPGADIRDCCTSVGYR